MPAVSVTASVLTPGRALTAAGQADLRGYNLALITRLLGESRTPLSRAEIASRTGLGRATVSRLTQELVDAKVVTELAPVPTDQRGRPATPLGLAHGTVAGIGLEVNVWYVAARALDLAGQTLGEVRLQGDFAHQQAATTLRFLGDNAARLVDGLRADGVRLAGAQLAIPGMVSADGKHLTVAPNLDWQELDPLDLLGGDWARISVPTFASNDANLQAIAVAFTRPGELADNSSFLYLAGDIGIGGALVREGTIESGEHGWAGEIGHISIDPDGPLCHCGSTGCLETYAGQASLMSAAGLAPNAGVESLIDLLRAGHGEATRAVERAAWALGVGIANVLNITDLSRVVLGTSLGRLLRWLDAPVTAQLSRRVLGASNRGLVITQGAQSDSPACTGGAITILNTVVRDPAAFMDAPAAG